MHLTLLTNIKNLKRNSELKRGLLARYINYEYECSGQFTSGTSPLLLEAKVTL